MIHGMLEEINSFWVYVHMESNIMVDHFANLAPMNMVKNFIERGTYLL